MILGKKDGALLSAYVEYFREVRLQVFKIVNKKLLNEAVVLVEVEAPFIAKKVLPGQFIIFRIDEQGERVPLTVADYDREKGTITLIVQMVGRTTKIAGRYGSGRVPAGTLSARWASQTLDRVFAGHPNPPGRPQERLRHRRRRGLRHRLPAGQSPAQDGR